MQIGKWQVDLDQGLLVKGRIRRKLTPKALKVLRTLASKPNELVSSESLLLDHWRGPLSADNALQKSISELRRAFSDNARKPTYIKTVSKLGYLLIAEVSPEMSELAGDEKFRLTGRLATRRRDAQKLVEQAQTRLTTVTNQTVSEARVLLEQALQIDPDLVPALTELVRVYLLLSELGEPWWSFRGHVHEITLQAELLVGESVDVLVTKATLLQKQAKDIEAGLLYQRALEIQPDNLRALQLQVQSLRVVGQYNEARSLGNTLVQQIPHSPDVNMLLAELCSVTGYKVEAEAYFQRALLLGPNETDVLVRAGNYSIWINADYDSALSYYFRARKIDPLDIRPATKIMSLMLFLDLPEEMQKWYRISEQINPHSHALAFWRMPGAEYSFEKRRQYIQNHRQQQPDERDWLRASGELELEISRLITGNPQAQKDCLIRAFDQLKQYLILGGELEFDSSGNVRKVMIRDQETLAMTYFCLTAEALGNSLLARQIFSKRIQFILSLEKGAQSSLHNIAMFIAHAFLGNSGEALKYLSGAGPQALKMFDLMGITHDQQGCWSGISLTSTFKKTYESGIQELKEARARVLKSLPDLVQEDPDY